MCYSAMIESVNRFFKQSIPVGCVPPACILYMLQLPPPDVIPRGLWSDVHIGHQMSVVRKRSPGLMFRGGGTMPCDLSHDALMLLIYPPAH